MAALPAEKAVAEPLASQSITVAPSWSVARTSVTIKNYSSPTKVYLNNYDGIDDIDAYSNASSIVTASVEWDSGAGKYYVSLQKKGLGRAIVTVRNYDDDTYRIIKVHCTPADFRLYRGNFTFQKSTCYYYTLTMSAQGQSDSSYNYYYDSYIRSAVSSNPKVASVKVTRSSYSGKRYDYATVTPKKTGTTRITYSDQRGRKLTYTITVKKDYWKANLKARTSAYIPYGEKKINAWSKPGAKVTLKIGGEKHTKKANKNGQAKFKLKHIYKIGKKYSVTAKSGKLRVTKKDKVYSSGGCYFSGTIWSCKRYMPIRAYNIHKGDYLVLSCGKEKHKRKFSRKISSWSSYMYMNYNLRNYRYRTIKINLYNKYKQKLGSGGSWYIRF